VNLWTLKSWEPVACVLAPKVEAVIFCRPPTRRADKSADVDMMRTGGIAAGRVDDSGWETFRW
jgi:hypothetical protein